MSTIINEEKNEVRRYLLGQLEEAEQERLELRLLTDGAFAEEFDTVVDEITDQYVGNELGAEERKRVEQYFLASNERQQKVHFADQLLQRAEAERGTHQTQDPAPAPAGILQRLISFWTNQSLSFRMATTVATIMIVAGLVFLVPRTPSSGGYAFVSLPIVASDRASGSETKTVRLEPGNAGIRIELALPDQWRGAKSYRVELLDERERSRDMAMTERNPQAVIVTIPANEITPGSYIVRVYALNSEGTEQRVRGSYYFNVQ